MLIYRKDPFERKYESIRVPDGRKIAHNAEIFNSCQCASCGVGIDMYTAYRSLELYTISFQTVMVCYGCFDKERERYYQAFELQKTRKRKGKRA